MKRVIITGGTGFVGSNLARRLLRDGHEVHLLVRPGYQSWRLEPLLADFHVHELHLHDLDDVRRVVHKIHPDWVFHLAVYGGYSWQTDLQQMLLTNVHGTINLVQACLQTGFAAFVNTGTSSEYGFKDHAPAETEALEPNSQYAVTKASATMFCRCTARREQVHLSTLRLYSVYGPYDDPTRLPPTLIMHGLRGELPSLANPEATRDYVYVEDVVDAYVLAATHVAQECGAIYNVGSGIQTTLRDVVAVARKSLGIIPEPKWGTMAGRAWDTNVWVADNRRICRELGWKPRFNFADGFEATVDWFDEEPDLLRSYESPSR